MSWGKGILQVIKPQGSTRYEAVLKPMLIPVGLHQQKQLEAQSEQIYF